MADLLELLAAWGPCPAQGPCLADLNGDGVVGVADLLILLAAWGNCPGQPIETMGATFQDERAAAGISAQQWDDYLDALSTGTPAEQRNWNCWVERYFTRCERCRDCPGDDPFN